MRRLGLQLLWYSGVAHLFRFLNRKKVTILMLHGVAGQNIDPEWQPLWPRISTKKLDSVLGQLAMYYQFVPLADAVAMLSGERPIVHHSLAVTFDDGYRNNVTEALPVLTKHGAPATFFVATGYIGTRRSYWIDRLDYALQKAPDSARNIRTGRFKFDLRNKSSEELQDGYRRLRLTVKQSIDQDSDMLQVFDSMATSLENEAGTTIDDVIDDDPFVTISSWDDLQSAQANGIAIGSHSVDHFRLDSVENSMVERQLVASKAEIERHLGTRCTLFCYPNGSFNSNVVEKTAKAGYDAAVTTRSGLNALGDNPYTLRRYSFPAKDSAIENLFAISGIKDLGLFRRLFGQRP